MKLIKTLFLWILLLCLPMQGYATASMVLCATMQAEAHGQSLAGDEHGHCEPASDTAAGECSTNAGCGLIAAVAAAAPGATIARPAGCGPIPYCGAYATAYCPDRLERPPHHAA